MKKIILYTLLVFSLTACESELVDFTNVNNPNLSESSVVGQENSSQIWLTGCERQLSIVLNEIVINAELASDNYNNDQTFYNQFLDGLDITKEDNDIRDMTFAIHRLKEMANFGMSDVSPNDPQSSAETDAEFTFLSGMSSLYAGMYYTGLPAEKAGTPLSATDNILLAADLFNVAIASNAKPEYHLALARAHYLLGNRAEAMASASAALAMSGDFTRTAIYDQIEGPVNVMESALYERGSFDDLQPLPTLDFLDPKYSFNSAAQDDDVNYLKAEEAMLIQIEGMIAMGDLAGAKTRMAELGAVVAARPVKSVDDSIEGRTEFAPATRPDSACVVVNGRAGLVLERHEGNVDIPAISGTSLTAEDIDGINTEDEALYFLYRTRQEIFIAEGMRMVDMGVKLVIGETEQLINDAVTEGSLGTAPQIPGFIDSVRDQLDLITYDPANCTATTNIDVSQLLVNNKTSPMVLPFH